MEEESKKSVDSENKNMEDQHSYMNMNDNSSLEVPNHTDNTLIYDTIGPKSAPAHQNIDPETPDTLEEIKNPFYKTNDARVQNTDVLYAIENHDISTLRRLLDNNANPNATCRASHVSACHLAVLFNNTEALELLLQHGAKRHRADAFGRTPLHLAAWKGNLVQIAILLDLPKDLQERIDTDLSDDTLEAVRRETKKTFKQALQCHVEVKHDRVLPHEWQDSVEHNCRDYNKKNPILPVGWTALHVASARARPACVRLLLAAWAVTFTDAFCLDSFGRTPLDVAGSAHYIGRKIDVRNFKEVINIFLQRGLKISPLNRSKTWKTPRLSQPLHTAVELQDPETVGITKRLLEAGASASALNNQGYTAMHLCVVPRLKDHLQLLVEAGDVDTVDLNGYTVLHAAICTGSFEGVRIAVRAGADIFKPAFDGNSPLHSAVASKNNNILREILSLIQYSKAIDSSNKNGDTALYTAVSDNNIGGVKILLDHGASIQTEASKRSSELLHVAAIRGYNEILELLLNHDDDETSEIINTVNENGYTPILYAAKYNKPECAKTLLSKNALIRVQTNCHTFTTALHVAATTNSVEVAKLIIAYNEATIHEVDDAGCTPLHIAAYCGSRGVIELLLKNRADLSRPIENGKNGMTAIDIIMKCLTNPTEFMEEMFDKCTTQVMQDGNRGDFGWYLTVKYDILAPKSDDTQQMNVIKALLNTGNRNGQRSLLMHPLVESFIHLKWKSLMPFFYTILVLYGCFVLSLNVYILSVFLYNDKYKEKDKELLTIFNPYVWKYFLFMTLIVIAVQEMLHMKLKTKSYFLCLETWVKLLVIVLSTFLPFVVTLDERTAPSNSTISVQESIPSSIPESISMSPTIPESIRLLATMAILMSWLEMTFLLSRLPKWGFYVLMFGKVASKVVKIFLVFSFLVFGFSMGFMIQFHSKAPFENPMAAFVKTVVMLTAEFDYKDTINKENAKGINASLPILRIIFVIFLMLASIVLMNLMVGVAVSDIDYLQKIGHARQLEKQVEFLTSLEKNVYYKFMNKLPILFKNYLKTRKLLVHGIYLGLDVFLDPVDLPSHIKYAFFEKAQSKKREMDDQAYNETFWWKMDQLYDAIVNKNQMKTQNNADARYTIPSNDTKYNDKIKKSMEIIASEMESIKQMLSSPSSEVNNSTNIYEYVTNASYSRDSKLC